jgi:hypothetical protein
LPGKPRNPVVLEPSLSAATPRIAVAARQVPRLSCATKSLTVGGAEVFAVLADGDAVTGSAAGDSAHYFGVCASAARVRDRLRGGPAGGRHLAGQGRGRRTRTLVAGLVIIVLLIAHDIGGSA